jgi:hypothetical protein
MRAGWLGTLSTVCTVCTVCTELPHGKEILAL